MDRETDHEERNMAAFAATTTGKSVKLSWPHTLTNPTPIYTWWEKRT